MKIPSFLPDNLGEINPNPPNTYQNLDYNDKLVPPYQESVNYFSKIKEIFHNN